MRTPVLAAALIAAALLAGCGSSEPDEPAAKQTPAAAGEDLGAIKAYLLDHTAALVDSTAAARRARAPPTASSPRARASTTPRCSTSAAPRSAPPCEDMQATWREANPRYEEMEGVVAGVPELSEFDVIIDAGADASDPENAVPFDVELPGGKVLEQPGNFFFLTETSLFGTNPDFQARGRRARPRRRRQGRASARRCPTRTPCSPSRATSRRRRRRSTRPRARGSPSAPTRCRRS